MFKLKVTVETCSLTEDNHQSQTQMQVEWHSVECIILPRPTALLNLRKPNLISCKTYF